ncbi:MAG: rRNA maturation RNase YbeY [Calditrichaeota bacterium]|nr:rRNA maturation RNase YbeY [Calditrichota bacterium]
MRKESGVVRVFNAHPRRHFPVRQIKRLAELVLTAEGASEARDVNVVLCDDDRLQELNRRFLGHDYPTDVVAFQLADEPGVVEGEVYVSLDRADEQARTVGVRFENEVGRLVVHGILHLLGYEDEEAAAAGQMHVRQEEYLRLFAERQAATESKRGN